MAQDNATGALKVLWLLDQNFRVYHKDENGRAYGGPIWRCHWREYEVVSETKRSWIIKFGKKVPKAGGYGIAFSQDEIDKLAFIEENHNAIAEMVRGLNDYDMLCKVAGIVGYKAK